MTRLFLGLAIASAMATSLSTYVPLWVWAVRGMDPNISVAWMVTALGFFALTCFFIPTYLNNRDD